MYTFSVWGRIRPDPDVPAGKSISTFITCSDPAKDWQNVAATHGMGQAFTTTWQRFALRDLIPPRPMKGAISVHIGGEAAVYQFADAELTYEGQAGHGMLCRIGCKHHHVACAVRHVPVPHLLQPHSAISLAGC